VRRLKEEKSKVVKGEWLNTPNSYARQETEETGTPNPKKITKWVPDASPSKSKTSTPIRIENKNQFAPQGADPKELKNHVKEMKQDRFVDKVTAGYQSKLLSNIEEPENGYTDGPDAPNGITRVNKRNG
jgi:adducin